MKNTTTTTTRNTTILLVVFCVLRASLAHNTDDLVEHLHIEVLPDGKVLSHFNFMIDWFLPLDNHSYQHTNLFPKSLASIVHDTQTDEFHLSFTQGRWRYSSWGAPSLFHTTPTGVELFAWFREHNSSVIETQWKKLVYSLGGVFCGSLQYIDTRSSSQPAFTFHHNGQNLPSFGDSSYAFHRMRYGALPREAVCTENHTPWLKLLPCREFSGLSYLMNPLRLYDVHYHSMQTHVRRLDDRLSLQLSVVAVMDTSFGNWQLTTLFGRSKGSITACPLARESRVSVLLSDTNVFDISPKTYETDGKLAVYNLKSEVNQKFDFDFKWTEKTIASITPNPPMLLATRVLTGYGGERGGFKVHLTNTVSHPLNITYFESVPWFVRTYYNTLRIVLNGEQIDITSLPCASIRPAELRGSPSTVELCLTIPAQGKLSISMEFEKEFLHYSEFPPDAHRGFDLPAAVVTVRLPNNTLSRFYTENLLLSLPTPDFSMLYNVITLTCTVMALFFGSIFNMSIRRLKATFTGKDFVSDRPLAKLYRMVTTKLQRFQRPNRNEPVADAPNNNVN